MNHIKLAYFCSSQSWGGLEMNHLRNAEWMSLRGHRVIVLGIQNSPIQQYAQQMHLPFLAIESHRRWYDFKAVKRAQAIIESEEITHFIIRRPGDMSLAAGLKYRLKENLHVSYFMEMQLGIRKKSIFHTIRFRYIDVWSCPLHWLKEQVEQQTRFRNRLEVIPSGVNLQEFAERPSMDAARKVLDLPQNGIIVGMAGRFDPKKGQEILLEAITKCEKTDFSILFMGETTQHEGTEYETRLHDFIKAHQLENRVIFRPYTDHILHFYRSIHWMVMASESETVGMVTIESLAAHTPVIGSNVGGTPEILNQEQGGVLFETMNSDDLARKLDAILTTPLHYSADQFDGLVARFDHHSVCAKVEDVLGIASRH